MPGASEHSQSVPRTQVCVRKVLNSSEQTQGRSSTIQACDKRGEAPSLVARGGPWMAHKHQNESQDKRLTEIPRWTPNLNPLASHSLSRAHCWSWSGVGRVQHLHHNPLVVFSWQHALQVNPVGHTCSILRYIRVRVCILIHILHLLAADM